jgi:hypothetical protein
MRNARNPLSPGCDNRIIRQFRSPIPPTQPVHRDPCILCGVRGDVGCRHLEVV